MRISDWSSDVCSSDLVGTGDEAHVAGQAADAAVALDPQQATGGVADGHDDSRLLRRARQQQRAHHVHDVGERMRAAIEIGSASCRERVGSNVEYWGVRVHLKKKTNKKKITHNK